MVGTQEAGRDTSDDKLQRESGKHEDKNILGRKTDNMERNCDKPPFGEQELAWQS